jgi:hypothetical protein
MDAIEWPIPEKATLKVLLIADALDAWRLSRVGKEPGVVQPFVTAENGKFSILLKETVKVNGDE